MARPLEDPLDVGPLAAHGTQLERDFPVETFARLRESLSRPGGRAVAQFRFHTAGAYPALEGSVRARAWLTCQRCLQEFEATLESPVRVAFVGRDAESSRVPDEYDAVTAPGGRIGLSEFVEEELLLALPLVPMHPTPADCALSLAAEGEAEAPRTPARPVSRPVTRPFADLRELMKR
ncbi:MAG: DUF177 domain-containing protein [Proteobacteria bacterium]|nr:DUF177 domain-containing protein [Pseudomonadota bacterium]